MLETIRLLLFSEPYFQYGLGGYTNLPQFLPLLRIGLPIYITLVEIGSKYLLFNATTHEVKLELKLGTEGCHPLTIYEQQEVK